ncbi:MAG: hypothetical protein H6P99_406 [Holophagaceae bacterium]|nr:hypothetical protein [Holophagaceae bacterium]
MLLPLLTSAALFAPPAQVAPAPSSAQAGVTPQQAEADLLDAYDWGRPLPPAPALGGAAARDLRWLKAAATFDPAKGRPASPFTDPRGQAEAAALGRLLKAPGTQRAELLRALPLRRSGTALALWRWGQRQARAGAFDVPLRQAWEDRLLAEGPALTRGYALRHALCWALAEKDEARFAALRVKPNPGAEVTLAAFQRLFGLLGAPSPLLRTWSLPGLAYQDLRLDQLGGSRVWICPLEAGPLPALPDGTAWIVPSASGSLDDRDASLSGDLLTEGQALAARLQAAGRSAHFAPSRSAFEQLGLAWFPILIALDAQGAVASVRMGDAAPRKP